MTRVVTGLGAVLVLAWCTCSVLEAQTRPAPRKPVTSKPASKAAAPALVVEPADMTCPTRLGTGISSRRQYCDVLTGRDPASGILVRLPPHKGAVTLAFDLHNRQTYSEEQVRARRAFARYTASIGVLTLDNTLISRAVIESEFRTGRDLVDRVDGGAGPGGVKAVAPTGTEAIRIVIPEGFDAVSILGEKLTVARTDGTETFSAPGRPIAVISDVTVAYQPAPPKKKPATPPVRRKR
jgi:hypothetical protein